MPETNIDGIVQDEATATVAPAIVVPTGYDAQEFPFHFKARAIRDESGKVVGKSPKQPSLKVQLPVPSHDLAIQFLSNADSAESKLIMSAIADIIYGAARAQFDEIIEGFDNDPTKVVAGSMLSLDKLDLTYLANLPPSTRASSVPDEDEFKAFFADYLSVMVQATGKEASRIERHLQYFARPTKVKPYKDMLVTLVSQLDIYLAASANVEEHAAAASYIREKFDRWSKEPEKMPDVSML